MKTKLILLAGLLSAGLLTASAQVVLTNQHVDIGVAFEDGAWKLHIHDESNDAEYEPDAAVLLVGSVARTTFPNDPAYGFLGRADARGEFPLAAGGRRCHDQCRVEWIGRSCAGSRPILPLEREMKETKKCQNAVQVEKDGQMQFTAKKIEL